MYPYPGQQPNQPPIGFAPHQYPNQPQSQPPGYNPNFPNSAPYVGAPYPPQNPNPGYPTTTAPYPSANTPYPSYNPGPPQAYPGQQTSPYPTLPGQYQAPAYPAGQPAQIYSANQFQATQGYPGQNPSQPSYPLNPPSSGYPQQQQHQPQVTSYSPHQEYPIAKAQVTTTANQASQRVTMQAYQETPTIREAHFVPTDDAKALRTAMKGFGTDEQGIINVVTKRTNPQRLQIIQAYKTAYGKDLIKDIKGEISGKFEDAIVALMTPRYDYIAKTLHDAISGIGTKEHVLIDILCTGSNQDIQWLNAAYYRTYGKPMEQDVAADTSGCFKRLMVSTCAAGRDENPSVDHGLASNDARELINAGIKKFGTDESTFNMILSCRSYPHLRMVFQEYEKLSGQDIERSIKTEFSGDIEDGLLAIVKSVKNRAAYFAERLKKAMQGMGTKDDLLIFILVTRAEIDLESIKQEYFRLYNKALVNDIQSETSGDYKKTLVALCG